MLAWLSILAYRNGAKKEGLGDKLAKIAPGSLAAPLPFSFQPMRSTMMICRGPNARTHICKLSDNHL